MSRPKSKPIVCVSCGCDDLHACRTEGFFEDEPCHWIAQDTTRRRGVCSSPACRTRLARFKAGDLSLSAKARTRQDKIQGRYVPRIPRMTRRA